MAVDVFWTLPRIAGVIIVGSALLLAVVDVVVAVNANFRAAEAMFRDIDVAVGNTTTLRVMSLSWGVWTVAMLAGFVVVAVHYWDQGFRVTPTLALVGLIIFATAWVIESAFHASVTVWAVEELEKGWQVPTFFPEIKRWLNFWLQAIVNPLALLALLGLAYVGKQTAILPGWAAWTVMILSGVSLVFPLPLTIAPIALFFGTVLLVTG